MNAAAVLAPIAVSKTARLTDPDPRAGSGPGLDSSARRE